MTVLYWRDGITAPEQNRSSQTGGKVDTKVLLLKLDHNMDSEGIAYRIDTNLSCSLRVSWAIRNTLLRDIKSDLQPY